MKTEALLKDSYSVHCKTREFNFIIDEPLEDGGQNLGPKPKEMVASALASCTAITLKMYAKRKEIDLGEISVEVIHSLNDLQPGDTRPKDKFQVTVGFSTSHSEDIMARLLTISKKCPVHQLLSPGSEIVVGWKT